MSTLNYYSNTVVQSVAMMSTTERLHGQFVTKESLLRVIIQDQFLALANSKIIKVDIYVIKKNYVPLTGKINKGKIIS
jgi:hypothetical protein